MTNTQTAIARLRELRGLATKGKWSAFSHPELGELSCYDASAIVAAMNSLDALLECAAQLEKCEAQFRWYADNHRAKGTPDGDEKAKTNDDMANECRAALQALAGGGE